MIISLLPSGRGGSSRTIVRLTISTCSFVIRSFLHILCFATSGEPCPRREVGARKKLSIPPYISLIFAKFRDSFPAICFRERVAKRHVKAGLFSLWKLKHFMCLRHPGRRQEGETLSISG